MAGYQPTNCIYYDRRGCKHDGNLKRFLFWKYKPVCNGTDDCKLAKGYPRPPRPPVSASGVNQVRQPMTINVSVNNLTDEDIKRLLDDDSIRNEFVRLVRKSAGMHNAK